MQTLPIILLVQFRQRDIAAKLEYISIARELEGLAIIKTKSGLCEIASLINEIVSVQGIIFGGSGDLDFDGGRSKDDEVVITTNDLIKKFRPIIEELKFKKVPTLGICFGHQLIGACHGISVINDVSQSKTKTHEVTLTPFAKDHPFFLRLPDSFAVQYGHKDVLSEVPVGASLVAHAGSGCRCAALAYSNTMATTQFHPELSVEDLRERAVNIPNYLPQGKTVEDCYADTPIAADILRNFAQTLW